MLGTKVTKSSTVPGDSRRVLESLVQEEKKNPRAGELTVSCVLAPEVPPGPSLLQHTHTHTYTHIHTHTSIMHTQTQYSIAFAHIV